MLPVYYSELGTVVKVVFFNFCQETLVKVESNRKINPSNLNGKVKPSNLRYVTGLKHPEKRSSEFKNFCDSEE